jgi:hypothetical protein
VFHVGGARRRALHISTATLWRKVKHHGVHAGQLRSSNSAAER